MSKETGEIKELTDDQYKEAKNLVTSAVIAYKTEEPTIWIYVQRLHELIPNEKVVTDILHKFGVDGMD